MDMSFRFPAADLEEARISAAEPDWIRDLDFMWLVAELHAELSEQRQLQLSR
jgi:hypothetical protein